MRWAAGFRAGPDTSGTPIPAPVAGEEIPGFASAWTVGPVLVCTVEGDGPGPSRIAAVGDCPPTRDELAATLRAIRTGRLERMPERPGSCLLVAETPDRTVVVGDHAGVWPVFYRTDPDGGVWWSNAATPLAALSGPPIPELRALAARTAVPDVVLDPHTSLFPRVARVPPGMALLCERGSARLVRTGTARAYAEPLTLSEGAGLLRTRLTEAVDRRVRSTALRSADLSGGLDSTTLAHLSARAGKTHAVTYTDEWLRNDDLPYATAAADAMPGVVHHVMRGDRSTLHYAGLDPEHLAVPFSDAPSPTVVLWAMKARVLGAMAAHGSRGHFVGTGADTVLTASGVLTDALRAGRRREAAVVARAAARVTHTSVWSLWRAARSKAALTLAVEAGHLAARLRGPAAPAATAHRGNGGADAAWLPVQTVADWMPRPARDLLADHVTDTCRSRERPDRLAPWRDAHGLARVGDDVAQYAHLAASLGMPLWAPFLDDEVVAVCFGVPPEERHVPGAYKPLLTRAMRGIVADTVLDRRTKGTFGGPVYAGLAEHCAALTELLGTDSRLARLGLVDPAPVSAVLRRAAPGLPLPLGSVHNLVAVEVWLRQLETRSRSTWWKENRSRALGPAPYGARRP
ncbi:asparagine synthase-related protein [Streptomyces sp. E-08]|uniref:asparagine synthase-related protein n=1 Tax=Streptomyces sp. E-08 TaxID=3404047 RepID=UPI003CEC50C6